MSMADAFAPIEAMYKAEVMADTWGHLAPKKNVLYRGRIVYAIGVFGSDRLNPATLYCELSSRKYGSLSSSPWFYDALQEFLAELSWKPGEEYPKRKGHGEEGCVYEWVGTFRNYQWQGTVRLLFDTNIVSK